MSTLRNPEISSALFEVSDVEDGQPAFIRRYERLDSAGEMIAAEQQRQALARAALIELEIFAPHAELALEPAA